MSKPRVSKNYKFLVAMIAIVILATFWTMYYKNYKEEAKLKKEKAVLDEELENLEVKLNKINMDLENSDGLKFIEKEARALGMIKPGETLIIDMDKDKGKKEN
ncbi:MAG: septum formation initiator family protein [Ezakiella sp.]|nr:septum formation initiator family protein [Ezakiella sp.]MDD7472115.1 septum formation initiator family protein [Bacillota bacterium]MDY3923726.1 septum formation initiator family protein [Ezakiella sp.]